MISDNVDKEAIEILRELFRTAERRILAVLSEPNLFSDEQTINAAQSVSARARIDSILRELGEETGSLIGEGALQVFEGVLRENIEAFPIDFTTDTAQAVEDVFNQQIKDIPSIFGRAAQDIRRGVIAATILGEPLDKTVESVQKVMNITENQATVLTNTTLISTEAASTVVMAEDTGVEMVYIYSGPDDKVTRPFCDFYGFKQGKVAYSRDALRELSKDPNQKKQPGGEAKDTAFFRGGWNCRHTWVPRPVDMALEDGYRIMNVSDVQELIRRGGSRLD